MSRSCSKTSRDSRSRSLIICWMLALTFLGSVLLPGSSHAAKLPPLPQGRPSFSAVQVDPAAQFAQASSTADPFSPEEPLRTIADPFEPVNRLFFHINDKFYFWLLKPVASGYKTVIPQRARVGVRNFFSNIATPIRLANCLLQFKFKGAGRETARFFVNTIIGVVGFSDMAKMRFNIEKQQEDFGQTMGFFGIGPIFYINWPIFGPSSLRDSVGGFADGFLDPWNYAITSIPANLGIKAYDRINRTSFILGEYEDLKDAALDPYVALRDAYYQLRRNKVEE